MKKTLLLFCFLAICLFPVLAQKSSKVLPESAGVSSVRLDRYSQFLNEEIKEGRLAGAVSLVSRKGQIVHEGSFGYSDLSTKAFMVQDQIFYIQSMTKPLVSVGIMMLYEEGHFFLNDPVSKYLPDFADLKVIKDPATGKDGEVEAAKSQVTISQCLSHTAGFSHGLGSSQLDQDILKALYFSPQENIASRVKTLASLPMVGHPGEQWYYSASPDILALLIEHFSGMPTAEFLQTRIFDPLGMKDTGYNLDKEQQKRMVSVHVMDESGNLVKGPQQTPMEGNTVYGGTHGMFSTAADYLKFCQMLLNGGSYNGHQLLSRKTIELMTANHIGDLREQGSPGFGFGLGFGVVTDLAESSILGSEGQYYWNGAFNTHFLIDPEEELIAILMTQSYPYSSFYEKKMRQFVYQSIVD